MFRIGQLEIHLINDADVKADSGGAFGLVPRLLWSPIHAPDDDHLVSMTLHNLVVRSGGKVIVIDTGLGDRLPPRMQAIWRMERPHGGLLEGLARLGIRPEDVDLVVDTHLHADHCAGNTTMDGCRGVVARFPRAEYVVQRCEFEDALHPNERTRAAYIRDNYEPLAKSGQLRLLDGEEEELAPGVVGVRTPGHTPGHMSVRLESEGQHAAFIGDMATYAVHFERLGWMTAYDVEPLVTLETKRRWQQWALEHNALLIFPHDPQVPAARLVQPGQGRPTLQPVAVEYA